MVVSPDFQKAVTKHNSTELEKVSGVNALTIDLEKISRSKQKARQAELRDAADVKVSKYAALDQIKHTRNNSGTRNFPIDQLFSLEKQNERKKLKDLKGQI